MTIQSAKPNAVTNPDLPIVQPSQRDFYSIGGQIDSFVTIYSQSCNNKNQLLTDDPIRGGSDTRGRRNGDDPGPDDAARDAPLDRGYPACGAHTNDRAGYRVRGADRDASPRRA